MDADDVAAIRTHYPQVSVYPSREAMVAEWPPTELPGYAAAGPAVLATVVAAFVHGCPTTFCRLGPVIARP